MSKIEAIGSKAADSSDWNHAWSVVAQLAAARGATLGELGPDDGSTPAPAAASAARARTDSAADLAAPFGAVAPDQLARDMAEIEQAAAALRRAEPTPERHGPPSPAGVRAPVARLVVAAPWGRWLPPRTVGAAPVRGVSA